MCIYVSVFVLLSADVLFVLLMCFPGEAVSGHSDKRRTEAPLAGHADRARGERQSGVGDAGRPAAHCRHPSEPTDPLPRTHHGQTG